MAKSTRTENRYAICVGINQYHPPAGLSPLRYAEGDAQAMDSLLGQVGFARECRRLLVGEEATLDAVNDALSSLILDMPGENDLVVFYFAGHSLPLTINEREVEQGAEPRSEVFLTTYDFDREKIKQLPSFRKRHALGMERLRKDYFEGDGSHKRLFLFDSCYSGDFFGPRYRDEANPVQGYIKRMLESGSFGRVALSSCLPIQKAVEDPALGHGRFTYYLLEALSGKVRDALHRDGCLTVNTLFEFLAKQLPGEQRPVLSGVQHDVFELVCYPDKVEQAPQPMLATEEIKRKEKVARLQAMLADHSSFLGVRLSSFVGRTRELAEIRQRIADKQQSGGYVTITGQAGQGKSSVIAKLVEEYGPENVAFHFIPFNPGPDHQVGLLRNLMARLVLKYDLPDLYVASESRSALRDYFPRVLAELASRGGKEVIFIDGLDQLEEEGRGEDVKAERDLSFLPNNPPPGIVFILGTRPNDTLRPLELLKPHYEYQLPNLSRQDFDLILQHRQVQLDRAIADQFYRSMQENALYLDLAAQELGQQKAIPLTEIIAQISHNPDNLFSLSINRLKRRPVEWREVIKPVLGVLLVAREPLALRHIRQIVGVDDDQLREAVERLGGLISRDWQQRYSIFHLKLYDYLRQDERLSDKDYIFATDEEEGWHNRLAQWCAGDNPLAIWQDTPHDSTRQTRHEYARKYYLVHLYNAHEWQRLFAVLDTAQYGRAKVHVDPSTRSYAQNVDLGRRAATWEGWTLDEGIALLPRLWQYTLLHCSLTSRADRYPRDAFRLLLLLGRAQEAIDLAELLTDPINRAQTLLHIAEQIRERADQPTEWFEVLMRAAKVAQTIEDGKERYRITVDDLSAELAHAQQWEEIEAFIQVVEGDIVRDRVLDKLGKAYIQTREWELTQAVYQAIEADYWRVDALFELGGVIARAQEWEKAIQVWKQVETMSRASEHKHFEVLLVLGLAFAQLQQEEKREEMWKEARAELARTARNIRKLPMGWREETLNRLGATLAQAQGWERVEAILTEAEGAIVFGPRDTVLYLLMTEAIQVQHWDRAEAIIHKIADSLKKANALLELSAALIDVQQWDRAEAIIQSIEWVHIEAKINEIADLPQKANALQELGTVLVLAQQWDRAEVAMRSLVEKKAGYPREKALYELSMLLIHAKQWDRAEAMIHAIEKGYMRTEALQELGIALAHAQQWDRAARAWKDAEILIGTFERDDIRLWELYLLSLTLAQAWQWKWAEDLARTIEARDLRARALCDIGTFLAQAQQRERATAIWLEAEAILEEHMYISDPLCSPFSGSRFVDHDKLDHDKLHQELGIALATAQQWDLAEALIRKMWDYDRRELALADLGVRSALEQEWEIAETLIHTIDNHSVQAQALAELSIVLARAQQWDRAKALICTIEDTNTQAEALAKLGILLVEAQQWERTDAIWKTLSGVINTIEWNDTYARALQELRVVLVQTQQWQLVGQSALVIEDNEERNKTLSELSKVFVQARQWDDAEALIRAIAIEWKNTRVRDLAELGAALAQAQQWERADAMWEEAEVIVGAIDGSELLVRALSDLGAGLAQAQQWERAEVIWREAEAATYKIKREYKKEEEVIKARSLRDLSETIMRYQRWDQAERVAGSILDGDTRLAALCQLGVALIQARQWERIEGIILNISFSVLWGAISPNGEWIAAQFGIALARAQKWDSAEDIISAMKYDDLRAKALSELSAVLMENMQWERAETVISSITDSQKREEGLRRLSAALAHVQQWERAEAVITSIEDDKTRNWALHELGVALVRDQQWDHAERVIRTIQGNTTQGKDGPHRIYALTSSAQAQALGELGTALARAQQWERAEAVISSIDRDVARAEALMELGAAFAQAQRWDRAETAWAQAEAMILAMEDNYRERAWELSILTAALAQAQQWDRAQALIDTIEESHLQAKALQKLGTALAHAQQWERAMEVCAKADKVIQTIGDPQRRIDSLQTLVAALVQAQQWEQAEAVVRSTLYGEERDKTLHELSSALAQSHHWERAQAVIDSIHDDSKRAEALQELSVALAHAQQWERAESVVLSIQKSEARSKTLRELAAKIATAHEYEQLLSLIRRSWQQVETRDDALRLFSPATEFIPYKPELGGAFYAAFSWVDTFLKGRA